MPLPFVEDIPCVLADLGVPVVLGSDSVFGILERGTDFQVSGETVSEVSRVSVAVQEGALTALAKNAAITVDAISYKVRRWEPHPDDHYFTRVHLVKV